MRIYLIRHGRQNNLACNVDVPLSDVGRVQAKLLGERLLSYPIDGLYSSNLIRAVETARFALQRMRELSGGAHIGEIVIREGMKEFDFGELTGQSNEAVRAFYQEYYARHQNQDKDLIYPSGEGGAQVVARAMPVMDEIVHSGLQHVAVVLHGGTIRALLAHLIIGDVRKRLAFGVSLENCSITELLYDEGKERYYLERFNDYSHLEKDESLLRRNWKI